MSQTQKNPKGQSAEKKDFPGYPEYPKKEDIYNRGEEESIEDTDDPKVQKIEGEEISMGEGLDVPGSELDDENEDIGEEDEENNYYSLGGDKHDDPEPEK